MTVWEPRARTFAALSLATLLASGCAYFRDTKSLVEEAEIARTEGDLNRAEDLYRKALATKSRDKQSARDGLVSLLLERASVTFEKNPDDAMPIYREILGIVPDSDEARIAYGRALMKDDRHTEAIDVLSERRDCRGCKSLVAVIYLERGRASLEEGEYADALSDFSTANDMVRDPMTVLAKVDVYTEGKYGSGDDAVSYLDHALRTKLVRSGFGGRSGRRSSITRRCAARWRPSTAH